MDQDFFDQGIQQFSGQFSGIFILFDQIDPLSRILGILVFFFQRCPKLVNLLVDLLLFCLILLRQHLEVVFCDILRAGIKAEKVDKAFDKLSYRDQTLLEQRNAICMRCGRVSDMKMQMSFEKLAELFEGSGASGAERAYKRAVENLILELVKLGQLHCIRLKQISTHREGKKIAAAIYAYQVDNGGEWGEIRFNLEEGTAWVETFAENDPCDTWKFTDAVISAVLACNREKLPKLLLRPISMVYWIIN